jgi:hypothetical protein
MRIIIMSKSKNKRGVALFLVLGFIAVMAPIMYMFSQIGSSQTRQAMKYHEHLRTELTAISGNTAMVSRLRGNQSEFEPMPNEISGSDKYSATIFKTGAGFLNQKLLLVLTQAKSGDHSYSLICDAEQFNPNPSPPVKVILHDYWGTIEPYQISLLADALAMQNYRGMELVRLEETRDYERSLTIQQYRDRMGAKLSVLPESIKQAWNTSVNKIAKEKLPANPWVKNEPSTQTAPTTQTQTKGILTQPQAQSVQTQPIQVGTSEAWRKPAISPTIPETTEQESGSSIYTPSAQYIANP